MYLCGSIVHMPLYVHIHLIEEIVLTRLFAMLSVWSSGKGAMEWGSLDTDRALSASPTALVSLSLSAAAVRHPPVLCGATSGRRRADSAPPVGV